VAVSLLVEETGYREKTTDLPQVTDNVLLSTPRHKFKGQGTSHSLNM
jgi:hypothetical protein